MQQLEALIRESMNERKWNKNSSTPRDYSKEYNTPGSKEQEERNKRKRDKRKHDKEFGECPEGTELHHPNGIEEDEVRCEPVSKNRGRKEKSRLKDGEIIIKIKESEIRHMVGEETRSVLQELFGSLAAKAINKVVDKTQDWATKKAVDSASEFIFGDDDEEGEGEEIKKREIEKKLSSLNIGSYDDLKKTLDGVFKRASKRKLSGEPENLKKSLESAPEMLDDLGE